MKKKTICLGPELSACAYESMNATYMRLDNAASIKILDTIKLEGSF